jgi:hypothetical protein
LLFEKESQNLNISENNIIGVEAAKVVGFLIQCSKFPPFNIQEPNGFKRK